MKNQEVIHISGGKHMKPLSPILQEWQGGTVVNLLQVCHQSGCSVRGELSLIPFIVDWHLAH